MPKVRHQHSPHRAKLLVLGLLVSLSNQVLKAKVLLAPCLCGWSLGAGGKDDLIFLWAHPSVVCGHFSSSLYFGKTRAEKTHKARKHFRRVTDIELQDKDEFLFSAYEDNGPRYVHAMGELLSDKTKLKEAIEKLPKQGDESGPLYMGVGVGTTDIPPTVMRERWFGIRALLQNNVIQRKDDSWEEDAHVVQTILEFERFLTIITWR